MQRSRHRGTALKARTCPRTPKILCLREIQLFNRDLKRLSDFANALFRVALLRRASAADYFEIGHLRQISQNVVLHTISEIRILFVIAKTFEREHGDAFRGHRGGLRQRIRCQGGGPGIQL